MFIAFFLSCTSCQYVTTVAGNGTATSINGQGVAATFNFPCGVAADLVGNLFVAEHSAHKIRKINATGFVSTLAGSGYSSFSDGQGIRASFYKPLGIYADSIGKIYVADNNNQRIRLINATGYVTTIAGSGTIGSADGQSTSASFNYPFGITVDSLTNIYITDQWNHKVRMINASGYVRTIAGNGLASLVNGQGVHSTFNSPNGIALDAFGNIYVADLYNNVIRMINSTGYVSTYAGSGQLGETDGGPISASFNGPMGLAIDSFGNLFVGELGNRIRMINTTGYVKTIAGNGIAGFRDGFGIKTEFSYPIGAAVDSNGYFYIADGYNNRIRKIDMDYTVTTTTQTSSPTTISASAISASTSATAYVSDVSSSMSPAQSTTSLPVNNQIYISLASNAFVSVFTGPIAYIMIVLGAISGAFYARLRLKSAQEKQLHEKYAMKRIQGKDKLQFY